MIFFMAMPFVVGLMNFVVPLQLGNRDVAFPTLNSVSFWLTSSGALLINVSLAVGEFSKAGWWGYPPLSELQYSPGVGVDYYLWSLQISGLGTLLAGINFVTTILKVGAPGHKSADCGGFSGANRGPRDAAARSLSRFPFLHERRRRESDVVRQPVLGLGTSGSLHSGPAGVRRVFRGHCNLLRQAAIRIPLDGGRDNGNLRSLLSGLAAPLFHDGRQRQR